MDIVRYNHWRIKGRNVRESKALRDACGPDLTKMLLFSGSPIRPKRSEREFRLRG